jgi:hypothetical protein
VTRGHRYGSRRNQFFFVNGVVRDVPTHAANRAAGVFDFDGHPGSFCFWRSIRAADNVHLRKTEVRLRLGSIHGRARASAAPRKENSSSRGSTHRRQRLITQPSA